MRNSINYIFSVLLMSFTLTSSFGQGGGGGCSPATTNGSCATAVNLNSGAACVNGTSCDGGLASGSSACISATGYECSWYKFTATATDMYVNIAVTATSGCYPRTEVFSGNCGSLTSLSCMSGAPLDDLHSLSSLTIGATYYIQVCYSPGGPCGNGGNVEYCIEVGEPDPPCDVCATPCGTAVGYPTNPTVQDVVDDCQTSPFVPELQPSSTHTFCYNFTATATSVDFNVIITSNCGGGNVTGLTWELYTSACGVPVQTGTLSSLTFSPVIVGADYVFCYTFTVPSTCTHSQHCPFFVGATVPLPIELVGLEANVEDDESVRLSWSTASEHNNDYFTIERTADGVNFSEIGRVDGAGNSSSMKHYSFLDRMPLKGESYYRLKQTDIDGKASYSDVVGIKMQAMFSDISIVPNPVEGTGEVIFTSIHEGNVALEVTDIFGRKVLEDAFMMRLGENKIQLNTSELNKGLYVLSLSNQFGSNSMRFIKN